MRQLPQTHSVLPSLHFLGNVFLNLFLNFFLIELSSFARYHHIKEIMDYLNCIIKKLLATSCTAIERSVMVKNFKGQLEETGGTALVKFLEQDSADSAVD